MISTSLKAICGVFAAVVLGILIGAGQPAEAQPATRGAISCTSSAAVSGSTAATAQLVALAAGKPIYVCAFTLVGGGATTAKLVTGTGTNCGTGTADLTGAMTMASGTVITGEGVSVPVGKALCWTNSGAVAVNGLISYAQP